MSKNKREWMGAYSTLMILMLLKNGETYGYKIMKELAEISNGFINWREGSLYPVLTRLETQGLIKSYWETENAKRPRKYFKILPQGKVELKQLIEERDRFQQIVNKLSK